MLEIHEKRMVGCSISFTNTVAELPLLQY